MITFLDKKKGCQGLPANTETSVTVSKGTLMIS